MAPKKNRTQLDLEGFEEITVTRTRHSEPTLYVNTDDAKYPIARLSMGAVTMLRSFVPDGEEIKLRLLHNAAKHIGILILDPAGYSVAENGGLSGGAFQDNRMLGSGVKAKFPVTLFGEATDDVRGLQFSTELDNATADVAAE